MTKQELLALARKAEAEGRADDANAFRAMAVTAPDAADPIKIVREELGNVAETMRAVRDELTEFRSVQEAHGGKLAALEHTPEDQPLISDTDAAREITDDYVKRLETDLAAFRAVGQKSDKVVSLPGVNDGKERFFFTRMAYGMATGEWDEFAPYEKEVIDQTRALTTQNDTTGGYLLPIQVLAEMIPLLRARQVLVQAGVRVLDGLSAGEITIPKQTAGATAYWVSPNTAPTESNLTVGLVTARPHTLAVHTIVEKALAMRGIPSVENMVRADAAEVWALEFDKQALVGTGESNKPLGLQNWPNLGSTAIGSISTKGDLDELDDMIGAVEDENALLGAAGWIIKPTDFRKIAKLKDTNGNYILRRDANSGVAPDILGYPVNKSTILTDGDFYFGNWQDMLLAEWGSLSAAASDQSGDGFLKRQIHRLLFQDVDSIVRNVKSFNFCDDLTA